MKQHYHLIGIGGIGMSSLARILLERNQKVTGSDLKSSESTRQLQQNCQLQQEGAKIFIGHSAKHVKRADIVVYSTDIPNDNIELLAAKKKGVPLLHRSDLLAELIEGYAPILISGTHGKTSTASLMVHLLIEAGFDPSFTLGGYLNGINTNGHHGQGAHFVLEADESDGSFLKYPSFGAIITNIEHDHMCYWKTGEALTEAFAQFGQQVGSKDHLFWCYDDREVRRLGFGGHSYGFNEKADLVIHNFTQNGWRMYFDLSFKGKRYKNLEIPLIGAHQVLNASAAFGLGLKLDVAPDFLRKGLKTFRGIGRRVEKKGVVESIAIYDDYAHHPTEIFATLRALRSAIDRKRLIAVFQPHRYTRSQYCMDHFAGAFESADLVIITDIFPAREQPIPGITPEKIRNTIRSKGRSAVEYIPSSELLKYLSGILKADDVLITMGAGDITGIGPQVIAELKK